MNALEFINSYDTERKNETDFEVKLNWVRKIERLIMKEIILTHEGASDIDEDTYFADWDEYTELLAQEPYDDLYTNYIDMRISYNNNEQKRYNMASTLYNNAYITFQDYYNRTHKPLSVEAKLFRHELL